MLSADKNVFFVSLRAGGCFPSVFVEILVYSSGARTAVG